MKSGRSNTPRHSSGGGPKSKQVGTPAGVMPGRVKPAANAMAMKTNKAGKK